jgi:hypothetical protein
VHRTRHSIESIELSNPLRMRVLQQVMHASYSERRAKSEEFVRRTAKEYRERSLDKQCEYANARE